MHKIADFHRKMKIVKEKDKLSPSDEKDASIKEVEDSTADWQFSFSQAQNSEIESADA